MVGFVRCVYLLVINIESMGVFWYTDNAFLLWQGYLIICDYVKHRSLKSELTCLIDKYTDFVQNEGQSKLAKNTKKNEKRKMLKHRMVGMYSQVCLCSISACRRFDE